MQQTVKCPNCGMDSTGPQFCTTCGTKLPIVRQQQVWEPQTAPAAEPTAVKAPPRKYGTLRAVAVVYMIIGWVICVGGSLLSIAVALMAAQGVAFLKGLVPQVAGAAWVGAAVIVVVGVVVSVLSGLLFLAFAELCNVAIDIEQNTRSKE
jgi:hypothetical protein